MAEDQAKVGGRKKGLGLGENLAEVCDGEVLQGATKAVEFDRKGLRAGARQIAFGMAKDRQVAIEIYHLLAFNSTSKLTLKALS